MLKRSGGTRGIRKQVMEKRSVGTMDVSVVALGCFAFGGDRQTGSHLSPEMAALHEGVWGEQDEADTFAAVKAALDARACVSFSSARSSSSSAARRARPHRRASTCSTTRRCTVTASPRR